MVITAQESKFQRPGQEPEVGRLNWREYNTTCHCPAGTCDGMPLGYRQRSICSSDHVLAVEEKTTQGRWIGKRVRSRSLTGFYAISREIASEVDYNQNRGSEPEANIIGDCFIRGKKFVTRVALKRPRRSKILSRWRLATNKTITSSVLKCSHREICPVTRSEKMQKRILQNFPFKFNS